MVYDQAEIDQHVVQTYSEIINPAKNEYNEDHWHISSQSMT